MITMAQKDDKITVVVDGKPFEFAGSGQVTAFLLSLKNKMSVEIDGLISKVNKG